MKKRLSKLALLTVAAAFIVAGFPACSDDDEDGEPPAQASATFALAEADETAIELTETSPTEVNATLTVTNGAFSDAVKALEVNASLADYLTVSAGEKVTAVAKLAEKVTGNVMKVTLTVTAETDAEDGEITATIKAPALTTGKELAATGAISYTVTPLPATAPQAELQGDTVEVTKGKTESTAATITLTKGAFSDAVKALELNASLADYLTVSADGKVTAVASLAEKVTGNTMKITLAVTAAEDAAVGDCSISVTIKADALADYDQAIAANGAVPCTVKAAAGTEVPDDPPAEEKDPTATLAGAAITVTAGGEAVTATATVTLTNGTFAATITKENFAATAGDNVSVTVTGAARTSDTVATLTLSVTAAEGATAGDGTISVTVNAGAVKDYDNAVKATGTVTYTVKEKVVEPPETVYTLTEASATISLGRKNVGTIGKNPNAGGKAYLSAATDNWNSSATVGDFTDEFYNLSGNSRSLTLTVKNVAGFKLYVKSSNADRTFTVKIGDNDTVTITHPGKQTIDGTQTDVIPFIFNTGTTEEVAIVIGGGSSSVYPAYVVLYDTPQDIPVERVEITDAPTEAVLLAKGTVQLGATVSPDRATDKHLTWTSGDDNIATVDGTGLVTLKAAGTVTVKAEAASGANAEAEIVIQAASVAVSGIAVADSDGATSGTMKVGKTRTLTATVSPDDASNKAVVWSSSDNAVATVKDGVVTAVAAGTATIKAAADADSSVFADYTLTVEASTEVKVWLGSGTADKNCLNGKLSSVNEKFKTHSDVTISDLATNDFVGSVKLHVCKLDSNGPNLYTKGKEATDTTNKESVDIDNDYIEFEVKKECTVSFTSVGNPASLKDADGKEIETQSAIGEFTKQLSAGTYRIYGTAPGGACKIKYITFE